MRKRRGKLRKLFRPPARCRNPPQRIVFSERVVIDPLAIGRAGWATIDTGGNHRLRLSALGIHAPDQRAAHTTGSVHNGTAAGTYRGCRVESKIGIGGELQRRAAYLSQPE